MVRPQGHCYQRLGVALVVVAAGLLMPSSAPAQALHTERVGVATELVLVGQPLAEATTVAWPLADGTVASFTSGRLTLADDLERALAGLESPPPVVVAVGAAQAADLRPALERALGTRPPVPVARPAVVVEDGGVERRLGTPGSEAMLRLEVRLPAPEDQRRDPVEVLWEALPELLAAELPGLVSRVDDDLGRLEARVDPELAEVTARQLRLQLARLAEDPRLEGGRLATMTLRLQARRQARLAIHPDGAESLASLWVAGGVAAVRRTLFGLEGVTLESVRDSARQWLPQHPGRIVLVLPPRVLSPRFAAPPERVQLANDLVAAVLERPGAGLFAVCVRPVVVPDVDGALTGTVLSRLAAEVRSSEGAPGWVWISGRPPLLELAAPIEGGAEILEVLQRALARIAEDDRPVAGGDPDARRRALDLAGRQLGLAGSLRLTPAELLRPSNLALGLVVPDAEAAIEALEKFRVGGPAAATTPSGEAVAPVPRTRESAPGETSVLVTTLELDVEVAEVVWQMAARVVEQRARQQLASCQVELLAPYVPGRLVLLLLVQAQGTLDQVERLVEATWRGITAPVTEVELAGLRRGLAVELAASASGPLGHARRCAGVAAGAAGWRAPSDVEMEVLTVAPEAVSGLLSGLASWEDLDSVGAGALPIRAEPGSSSR